MSRSRLAALTLLTAGAITNLIPSAARAADYAPFDQVIKGFTKLEPPREQADKPVRPMYGVYVKPKEGQVLLEIPKTALAKKYFIGLTVASGQVFAGLQAGDYYVQWRQYNKRLALIAPNTNIRSGGDTESKDSVRRLFTGRVLVDLPIISVSPSGGFVVDGDALLIGNASVFFGADGRSRNPGLAKIVKSKVFPQNIEMAFELPNTSGNLQTLYYSISEIPASTGYSPRKADQRIGYFTTSYEDYGKYKENEVAINYINRWHLQKRDPSLKVSPPVKPITFYLEHTTPVRYRRWVKAGVEYWNEAFEAVGISDAIVVHYQDKATGQNMDKDPEDVRYNFIRWLNNDVSTAIGPSRVHPETGQILDADIVLTDGWIRHFNESFQDYMPLVAMQGMNAESLAWLAQHPNWDPRIRFAEPSQRAHIGSKIRSQLTQPYAGHAAAQWSTPLLGDDPLDGLVGRTSQVNGMCLAATGRRIDTAVMRMILSMGPEALFGEDDADESGKKKKKKSKEQTKDKDDAKEEKEEGDKDQDEKKEEPKKPAAPEEPKLDGMPESFIGPLLADLVAHEVGHTLGLRHNFKASSIYTLAEINSGELKGKKAFAGSVMDYLPINLRLKEGKVQGDYAMIKLGPYDMWAIQYGYGFEKDQSKILNRVSEAQLQFATDEDTLGPDPLARRYDFSKNPLDYAQEQKLLIERFRKRLMTEYVKDGDSWTKAREGYELTLNMQMKVTSMMSNWIGGAFINRDKKGDPNGRLPVQVVPAKTQRDALQFVIESTFRDEAYALSPELLARLTKDFFGGFGSEPTWPVHDNILSMQASTLTQLMNSTTLRRVYDNEFMTPADQDALTLPELLDSITSEIWSELDGELEGKFTTRKPMISSLRRNLQREHMERLIDLMLSDNGNSAAYKAIANLCTMELRQLKGKLEKAVTPKNKLDPYSRAHLYEAAQLIGKALDADFVYNQPPAAGGFSIMSLLGEEAEDSEK